MVMTLLYLVIIIAVVCGYSAANGSFKLFDTSNIPSSELDSLHDLYNSTQGDNWNWDGLLGHWNFSSNPQPCEPNSTWQGLTCISVENQYHIQQIDLNSYNLTGPLPYSIGSFEFLTVLELGINQINATIPSSITNLTNLTTLSLYFNLLTGTIPDDIGNIFLLNTLELDKNYLNGSIPSTLLRLSELIYLSLEGNLLTGTIPNNIGDLSFLTELELGDNLLEGSIPASIVNLSRLKKCDLFDNRLTGSIPWDIDTWSNITQLNLYDNLLNGSIPSSITNMTTLNEINFGFNELTGPIPPLVTQLRSLVSLFLSYNKLTGTIPDNIGELQFLAELTLEYNEFVGSIPASFVNISALEFCDLTGNYLTGSIPTNMDKLSLIKVLAFSNNRLNGSFPSSIANLVSLTQVDFASNQLTGTIPENIGNMKNLHTLEIEANSMTGSIPSGICNISGLFHIFLSENYFSKSIPDCVSTLNLTSFEVNENSLSGTLPTFCGWSSVILLGFALNNLEGSIPCTAASFLMLEDWSMQLNSFTGELPFWNTMSLFSIAVYNNHLYGPLFDLISSNPSLFGLYLNDNLFSGTIATHFSTLFPSVADLEMYNNIFSGSFPLGMSELPALEQLLVSNNRLTGNLDSVFSSGVQALTNIDMSSNQFTGAIPDTVYNFYDLEVFNAAGNCIQGTISAKFCNCPLLTQIVLDGLHTGSSCQHRFFPHNSDHKAYYLDDEIGGTIPSCLFELPLLTTLHLSGNGIGGSLSSDMAVSSSLTDLSLSHNILTGTIPSQLQNKQWTNFDLSYNRLSGEVSSFADQRSNTSVSLNINRLSGVLPASIIDIINVDVLDGNMFSCDIHRTGLPSHDKNEENYECGSNSLNTAMYLSIAFLSSLFIAFALLLKFTGLPRMKEWMNAVHKDTSFTEFLNGVLFFRNYFAVWTVHCLVFLMPCYIALSYYYSTYSNAYAWQVSAAFVSGKTAAIVLLVFWLEGCISLGALLIVKMKSFVTAEMVQQNESNSYMMLFITTGLVLVNALIVTLVNVAYVYVNSDYNAGTVVVMQFFVVIFKRIWNGVVVSVARNLKLSSPTLIPGVILFNNIVAPFIATAFISSDCFYNVIVTPATVTTKNYVDNCVLALDEGGNEACLFASTVVSQTSYVPPFIYNYQCASTFISAYTNVYVYMFLEIAVGTPLLQLIVNGVVQKLDKESTVVKYLLKLQWTLLREVRKGSDDTALIQRRYFDSAAFVSEIISALGILITFGVVFPPLSVVVLAAMVSKTYCTELLVGRLLSFYHHDSELRSRLSIECNEVMGVFGESVRVVVPVVAVFYAFLLFDTLGDAVGWRDALWLPFTVLGIALLVWLGWLVWNRRRYRETQRNADNKDDDIELRKSTPLG